MMLRTSPRPAPDLAREPAPAAIATCFEAAVPQGRLRLTVSGPASPHAAAAAVALADCEPLLGAFDNAAGASLDWRWMCAGKAPAADAAASGAARATCTWRGGAVEFSCPWDWLRSLPPGAGAPIAGLPWRDTEATLVAARIRLPRESLAELEPGGAVIVPQSMLPAWHGVLRARDGDRFESGGLVVALGGTPGAMPFAPTATAGFDLATVLRPFGERGDALIELRLAVPDPVPVSRLAGWHIGGGGASGETGETQGTGGTARIDAFGPNGPNGPNGPGGAIGPMGPTATLWRCAEAGCDDGGAAIAIAGGRLMPWGDGWALALEAKPEPLPDEID